MPWIESHQKLERHPKTLELCSKTGWNIDETIGKLHRLWWWTLDFAEDGLLGNFRATQYLTPIISGDLTADRLLEILKETNFIDKNGKIHDWWDYAGRYLTSKYKTSNPKHITKIEQIYQSAKRLPKVTLKTPHQPTNQPNQDNLIISQIENLLGQFPSFLKENLKIYLERVAKKNKTGMTTNGRKVTLLTELYNTWQRGGDDNAFAYAIEQAINYDAPNIGYINAIIKNKKTQRPR